MLLLGKYTTPLTLIFLVITLFSCKSSKVIDQPKVEIPEVIEKPKAVKTTKKVKMNFIF